MANTPTTPASVASRLTDEIIEHLIDVCDKDADRHERESIVARRYNRVDSMRTLNEYASDERLTASVLRDYVRLKNLVNEVKRKVKIMVSGHMTFTVDEIEYYTPFRAKRVNEILLLLTEAEKESEEK